MKKFLNYSYLNLRFIAACLVIGRQAFTLLNHGIASTNSIVYFFVLLFIIGCGKNVDVSGTVTFSDDGAPVPVGTVCFVPESNIFLSRGELKPDGTYKIGTTKTTDGLPPGTYNVYLDGTRKLIGTNKVTDATLDETIETPIFEELVDPKFHNKDTSGLSVEIKRSTKFDFKVDRYKKGK
ncbi:MAG: hypothetical protein LBP59_06630 [Planctomycetaceae bacterium]|jgi:hypothetical protein|nr:hypothetical protein [Planctomycetaceae bacterium]